MRECAAEEPPREGVCAGQLAGHESHGAVEGRAFQIGAFEIRAHQTVKRREDSRERGTHAAPGRPSASTGGAQSLASCKCDDSADPRRSSSVHFQIRRLREIGLLADLTWLSIQATRCMACELFLRKTSRGRELQAAPGRRSFSNRFRRRNRFQQFFDRGSFRVSVRSRRRRWSRRSSCPDSEATGTT